jgi:hypothetical protein
MFLRLAVLAAAFGHPACALMQLDSTQYISSSGFRTIEQARLQLFAVLGESNSFTIASNVWRDALFATRQWCADGSHHARLAERKAELDSLFADLRRRHDKHIVKLHQWRRAFECKSTCSKSLGYFHTCISLSKPMQTVADLDSCSLHTV